MSWYSNIFNCINMDLGGKSWFNKSMTNKKLAEYKNNLEFQNAFARTVKEGLARYGFDGLPDTVNERVLKLALLFHGSVCFFEKEGNVLALPANPNSNLTLYGDFKSCFVYGRNGYNEEIPLYIHGGDNSALVNRGYTGLNKGKPRGVWIRENELAFPFLNYCIAYADKIADTMRTIDVSRANLKKPYLVAAEEQVVPSVKEFFKTRDNNEEYIVSSGVFPADKINILPFDTTVENLTACTDLIEWYFDDFRSLCGKNSNANPDKKERLLVDEVNANNEATDSNIDSMLEFLQEGLDDVNKYLGTNITVYKLETEEEEDDNEQQFTNFQTAINENAKKEVDVNE